MSKVIKIMLTIYPISASTVTKQLDDASKIYEGISL